MSEKIYSNPQERLVKELAEELMAKLERQTQSKYKIRDIRSWYDGIGYSCCSLHPTNDLHEVEAHLQLLMGGDRTVKERKAFICEKALFADTEI